MSEMTTSEIAQFYRAKIKLIRERQGGGKIRVGDHYFSIDLVTLERLLDERDALRRAQDEGALMDDVKKSAHDTLKAMNEAQARDQDMPDDRPRYKSWVYEIAGRMRMDASVVAAVIDLGCEAVQGETMTDRKAADAAYEARAQRGEDREIARMEIANREVAAFERIANTLEQIASVHAPQIVKKF